MESLWVFPTPWLPNAGHQARREAGAPRTLEAVRCKPLIMIEASPAAYYDGMLTLGNTTKLPRRPPMRFYTNPPLSL